MQASNYVCFWTQVHTEECALMEIKTLRLILTHWLTVSDLLFRFFFLTLQMLKKKGSLFDIQHYGTTVSWDKYVAIILANWKITQFLFHLLKGSHVFFFFQQYKLRVHTQEQYQYLEYMPEIKEVPGVAKQNLLPDTVDLWWCTNAMRGQNGYKRLENVCQHKWNIPLNILHVSTAGALVEHSLKISHRVGTRYLPYL